MSGVVLVVHAFATLSMTGLIWFVQVVHYPLMGLVGALGYEEYQREHQRRTTWVVGPLMLAEALTAGVLVVWRGSVPEGGGWAGAGLLMVAWGSTFGVQVPLHERLARGFEAGVHRRLVRTNWVRTVAWSGRGVLALWMMTGG